MYNGKKLLPLIFDHLVKGKIKPYLVLNKPHSMFKSFRPTRKLDFEDSYSLKYFHTLEAVVRIGGKDGNKYFFRCKVEGDNFIFTLMALDSNRSVTNLKFNPSEHFEHLVVKKEISKGLFYSDTDKLMLFVHRDNNWLMDLDYCQSYLTGKDREYRSLPCSSNFYLYLPSNFHTLSHLPSFIGVTYKGSDGLLNWKNREKYVRELNDVFSLYPEPKFKEFTKGIYGPDSHDEPLKYGGDVVCGKASIFRTRDGNPNYGGENIPYGNITGDYGKGLMYLINYYRWLLKSGTSDMISKLTFKHGKKFNLLKIKDDRGTSVELSRFKKTNLLKISLYNKSLGPKFDIGYVNIIDIQHHELLNHYFKNKWNNENVEGLGDLHTLLDIHIDFKELLSNVYYIRDILECYLYRFFYTSYSYYLFHCEEVEGEVDKSIKDDIERLRNNRKAIDLLLLGEPKFEDDWIFFNLGRIDNIKYGFRFKRVTEVDKNLKPSDYEYVKVKGVLEIKDINGFREHEFLLKYKDINKGWKEEDRFKYQVELANNLKYHYFTKEAVKELPYFYTSMVVDGIDAMYRSLRDKFTN